MQAIAPLRVFIVDDSKDIRERLVGLVEAMGDAVVVGEAACAADAIASILAKRPDCVLLDLYLQDSNGMDVLRNVVPQAPGIGFIVITNQFDPQYRAACLSAGARYFLDKSRDLLKVPGAIAEIAERKEKTP